MFEVIKIGNDGWGDLFEHDLKDQRLGKELKICPFFMSLINFFRLEIVESDTTHGSVTLIRSE